MQVPRCGNMMKPIAIAQAFFAGLCFILSMVVVASCGSGEGVVKTTYWQYAESGPFKVYANIWGVCQESASRTACAEFEGGDPKDKKDGMIAMAALVFILDIVFVALSSGKLFFILKGKPLIKPLLMVACGVGWVSTLFSLCNWAPATTGDYKLGEADWGPGFGSRRTIELEPCTTRCCRHSAM